MKRADEPTDADLLRMSQIVSTTALRRVSEVQEALRKLRATPLYEDGDVSKGVSVQFLARWTLLENAALLRADDDPFVVEARGLLG